MLQRFFVILVYIKSVVSTYINLIVLCLNDGIDGVLQEATDHRSFGPEIDVVELLIIYFLPIYIIADTVYINE